MIKSWFFFFVASNITTNNYAHKTFTTYNRATDEEGKKNLYGFHENNLKFVARLCKLISGYILHCRTFVISVKKKNYKNLHTKWDSVWINHIRFESHLIWMITKTHNSWTTTTTTKNNFCFNPFKKKNQQHSINDNYNWPSQK